MITCPNCKSELFKAEKLKSELGAIMVRLTCSKCGHRLQVWIENATVKGMTKEIKAYNEKLLETNRILQGIIDIQRLIYNKSRPWWKKLLEGREG